MLWLKRNKATNEVAKNRLKHILTKSKLNSDRKVTVAAHSLAARLLATRQKKKRPRKFQVQCPLIYVKAKNRDFPKG